ncbi:YebC/PmpR family DNA-binding transcriptional regulator [Patescibacteria group bacterium]|nr:YebC/PmpR family DNA-binding transcriptional regulator [Patescibacteria group bacterium]MBU1890572.1 YebC/PmpR family DNA-binding transcriptional regulator [Patescibacteria group bacterium]
MSGHSKWSTIKRQKGATDAKRGNIFTKLSNKIAMAVRDSGEKNPDHNFKLRVAIDQAKSANMPNNNIEKAIKRGAGEIDGVTIESITYEGFGPNGIGLIIEVLTDNKNRIASEIRAILNKHSGGLGAPNSVAWQFTQKGIILLPKTDTVSLEDLEAKAIEAGAEDIKNTPEGLIIYTAPDQLKQVHENLEATGLTIESSELCPIPNNTIDLNEKDKVKLEALLEELENNQDVSATYTNTQL